MPEMKQYINLEPDPKEKRHGRIAQVVVRLNLKKARNVSVFLKPDKKNEKLKGSERAVLDSPGTLRKRYTTEADGTLKVNLVLSTFGGDKFEIDASKDKDGKKGKKHPDQYIVWRKLYYQTSRMKTSFSFPFSQIEKEYNNHFIELENTSVVNCPYKDNLETHELPSYQSYFMKKMETFEAHIVLIDKQCDSEMEYPQRILSTLKAFVPLSLPLWNLSDGWLKDDKWSYSDGSGSGSGGFSVTPAQSAGKTGVLVNFTGTAIDPTKKPVEVDLSIKLLKGSYTGDATYKPHVFIAVGAHRSDNSKSKTVSHEIGHGIGMVSLKGHDLQYDNRNGGMGSHCRYQATPDKPSMAQKGTFSGTYKDGKCVMYAFSSEHYQFCQTCKQHVLAAKLNKSAMKGRGW